MKPQDILFIVILLVLIFLRKPRVLVWFGLGCILLSMPLFYRYVFFTAERLVMYAAGFLLTAIIFLFILDLKRKV